MKIIECRKMDTENYSNVTFVRIEPENLSVTIRDIIASFSNMAWISQFDEEYQRNSFARTAEATAKFLAEKLRTEEENGTPVNVSMDCLSGETLGKSLPFMARGGYWIVISTLAGIETTVLLRPLLTKGLHLVGSMLRNRTPEFKAYILSELVEKVWPKIESGAIKPSIYKVLPIEKAEEAHAILERGENVGKVVLRVIKES